MESMLWGPHPGQADPPPVEIAEGALPGSEFSDAASFVTGHPLIVDGAFLAQ
jgi:hypothetical protein